MRTHHFSRRAFLRGAGVTMALPWLESLPVWGDEPRASAPESQAPVRLAVLFSGNGFHSREWWAKGEGKQMELGQVLAPLAPFREKMLFIKGLYNEEALKGNIHSSQTGNLLSGAPLSPGGEIRSGTSIDQVVAQRHGRSTKVPSLVLGCAFRALERTRPVFTAVLVGGCLNLLAVYPAALAFGVAGLIAVTLLSELAALIVLVMLALRIPGLLANPPAAPAPGRMITAPSP